ncbi:hypothetical protein [Pseudomonas paraeruginosa]|uniref:hypothetical protein n=1 Tax=Pseudomonas paraeruginosa TaxID=2994495 RepID=UPI00053D7A55|nr:hypothetical protein [Pseudomonas paraeruginosa]
MTTQITNSKEITLGDKSVLVRELTVLQVRDWLAEMQQPGTPRDPVDEALFPECSLTDLQRMTSLTAADIDQLRPSQLREVLALCKELNPSFFAFMGLVTRSPGAPA